MINLHQVLVTTAYSIKLQQKVQ